MRPGCPDASLLEPAAHQWVHPVRPIHRLPGAGGHGLDVGDACCSSRCCREGGEQLGGRGHQGSLAPCLRQRSPSEVTGEDPKCDRLHWTRTRSIHGQEVEWTCRCRTVLDGGRTIVEAVGEIDVYTAPKLREQLTELVDAGRRDIIVDMQKVEFLDSTGLGVLVGGLKRVSQHGGSLRLVCTQERILKIFRITGLTKVFAIYGDVAAAVAADD